MATWGESKRKSNFRSHAVDLASIEDVFDTPLITKEDTRFPYGEQRLQSLGLLNGEVVFLVWTERESGAHVISCRKAEKYEQKFYFANIEI